MKKYEFTGEVKKFCGSTLHQIRAVKDFAIVKAGDIGGWIEKEENLRHDGNAWVCGDALVYGNARVYGDAEVCGNAQVSKQSHWLCIGPIGSRNGFTTFFRSKGRAIFVSCGCFRGDIDAFCEKVKLTHGDNQYAKAYMIAAEQAKATIDLSGEE